MKKLYLVCLLVLILPGFAFSQFNLQFGYGVSYCNPGDINRLIYVYNNVNRASITKEMPKVHFMHGYDLGVTFGDRFKIEIHRTSRRANVMAEGMVNGESRFRQLRIISNTMGFGFGAAVSRRWDLGFSIDIGNFKGFGRTGAKGENPKYDRLFIINDMAGKQISRVQFGFTMYAQRNFGRFGARLYWQWQAIKKPLDRIDSWMLNGQQIIENHQLEDKVSNLGFQLLFRLGKINY